MKNEEGEALHFSYLTLAAPSNPPTAYTNPFRTATPHRQRRIVNSGPSAQVWFFTSYNSVLLMALGAWPPTINMYWAPPMRALERTGLWLPADLSVGGVRWYLSALMMKSLH